MIVELVYLCYTSNYERFVKRIRQIMESLDLMYKIIIGICVIGCIALYFYNTKNTKEKHS